MRYLLLALFISSCGSGQLPKLVSSTKPVYVDEEVIPFLERFDTYAAILRIKPNYTDLVIYRTDEPPQGKHLAICRSNGQNIKEIIIYNQFWDEATDVGKEIVVFHELGHCALKQEHRKFSVMQSTMLLEEIYISYYDDFIKELFLKEEESINFRYLSYGQ